MLYIYIYIYSETVCPVTIIIKTCFDVTANLKPLFYVHVVLDNINIIFSTFNFQFSFYICFIESPTLYSEC